MTPEEKEIQKLKGEIKTELRAIFKANMKIFDWDIPEANDQKAAELIVSVMQEALDEIKKEVAAGEYANY
ncbi:MAG: hypothetical protein DSZ10_06100 [Sulfurovum sp.]|jgi:hypothetical protein|nr:MAG: hypothetical protein DSZ10_06100 [Sulfurovum sp.]